MKLGRAVVSQIIASGDIETYINRGFNQRWMEDPDHGSESVFGDSTGTWYKAYLFLLKHYEDHGKAPSAENFLTKFGDVNLIDQDDSPSELIERMQDRVRRTVLSVMLETLQEARDTDNVGKIEAALIECTDIMKNGVTDNALVTEIAVGDWNPLADLDREMIPGIPFGIPEIDENYFGLQPSWLVTIVGRQKAKKSWLMLLMALAAWRAGRNVLFYSVELSMAEAMRRIYSLAVDMPPGVWSVPTAQRNASNSASATHRNDLEKVMREQQEAENKITVKQVSWQVGTAHIIRDVRSNPTDVIFFDGVYELKDNNGRSAGSDWQAQESVAQELKNLALTTGVTVVTTTQSQEKQQSGKKKPGIQSKSTQGGTAFQKYADLMLGLDYEDDGDRDEIYMTNILHRHEAIPEVVLSWEFYDGCNVTARPNEGGADGQKALVSKFMDRMVGDGESTIMRPDRSLEEAADDIIERATGRGRRVRRPELAEA